MSIRTMTLSPIASRFEDADGFYEQLLDAHAGLSREQSEALNARLVLLLANEVGDAHRLATCVLAAREALDSPAG